MRFGLSPCTVEKISTVFSQFPALEKVVLYGSRAKGNFKPGSDIDLTLHGQSLTPQLCATIAEALDELLLPYKIDLSVFQSIDNPQLREHVARVGLVFYERKNLPPSRT